MASDNDRPWGDTGARTLDPESKDLEGLIEERDGKFRDAEKRQRVLLEVNNAIVANLDRERLLAAVALALSKILRFDWASVTVHDPQKDVLQLQALVGDDQARSLLPPGVELPREGSHLEPVFQERRPLVRNNLKNESRSGVHALLLGAGIRSYVAAPLTNQREVFGTLNLASRQADQYSQGDVELLTEVSRQVALAVQNMLAYEEIARLKARLEEENIYLQEEIRAQNNFGQILGVSSAIIQVLAAIETVAPTGANVFITGETGTGKELVARAIHDLSRRRDKPLIKVNCASIPRELFESEFFGHVKGAFTGAMKDRLGRFELADGGTLFLDEVGEIPPELQSKLLRVLQEGTYERVGEEHSRKVDVRIIAATNKNLLSEMEAGRFRRDLYYRLHVFPIEISPLRERRDDIPVLATHFLEQSARRLRLRHPHLTPSAIAALQEYDWPGNVRELQNVIERALISCGDTALRFDLPLPRHSRTHRAITMTPGASAPGGEHEIVSDSDLRQQERENILRALRATRWRIYGPRGAAKVLGVKPSTLSSRIKRMGLRKI